MGDNGDARTEQDGYLDEIKKALESSDLPQFYANSFTITLGTGDILIVMKRNQKQVGTLQVSYTVAKSLMETLGEVIHKLEVRTGNTIMTSKFIEQKMQKGAQDDASE